MKRMVLAVLAVLMMMLGACSDIFNAYGNQFGHANNPCSTPGETPWECWVHTPAPGGGMPDSQKTNVCASSEFDAWDKAFLNFNCPDVTIAHGCTPVPFGNNQPNDFVESPRIKPQGNGAACGAGGAGGNGAGGGGVCIGAGEACDVNADCCTGLACGGGACG